MSKGITTVSYLMAELGYLCSFDLPLFLCASQASIFVIVLIFPCTEPFSSHSAQDGSNSRNYLALYGVGDWHSFIKSKFKHLIWETNVGSSETNWGLTDLSRGSVCLFKLLSSGLQKQYYSECRQKSVELCFEYMNTAVKYSWNEILRISNWASGRHIHSQPMF